MQQPVQHRRNFYNGIKLFCKADYKIIDVRINAQDSHEYCKDNHGNRNERKNKTKGAGRSTFPQGIFRKVGKRKVKNLPEPRKNLLEISFQPVCHNKKNRHCEAKPKQSMLIDCFATLAMTNKIRNLPVLELLGKELHRGCFPYRLRSA